VAVLLAAFLFSQYGWALRASFVNDDYVFLDQTRSLPFLSVWVPHVLWLGRYYRPWSRELHYWTLQHLFGSHEVPFHVVSLVLGLGVLVLYFQLARRLAGTRVAGVATAGVATLVAWGMPMVWAAGAQDLWMMLFALASLLLLAQGRRALATLAYALALLSKETAALLPGIGLALGVLAEGRPLRAVLRRVTPMLVVGVAWAAFHPQFGGRLWCAPAPGPAVHLNTDPARTALRTLLAVFNLDAVPRPEFGWRQPLLLGAIGSIFLAGVVCWTLIRSGGRGRDPTAAPRHLVPFAVAWTGAAWLPLAMPSIGWHVHYALFGMLGAWLALGVLLARRLTLALAVVVALALLRAAQAARVSEDWGDEWYRRRAAEFLGFMQRDLHAKAPSVLPGTRFFFWGVPSHVGFLAGNGPAIRVWYGDSSLRAGLLSDFQVRPPGSPRGRDLFFRYDSTAGWVNVHEGPEDVARARAANPRWREDNERLAVALARGGDWPGTAAEYAKLAEAFPADPDYAYYAGLAALAEGDTAAARGWLGRAAGLPGADEEIRAAARELGLQAPPRAKQRR
jgi:hypothetical protein